MRRLPDLEAEFYVQEHQDALQFRTGGDRGRDTCRLAPVCEEIDRLQQAIQGERGSFLLGGRGNRGDLGAVARLAGNQRAAQGPGVRGGQGESALGRPVRRVIGPPTTWRPERWSGRLAHVLLIMTAAKKLFVLVHV